MFADFLLAALHHLLVFIIVGAVAAQLALVRPGLSAAGIGRVARFDAVYGGAALALLVVGVGRVVWGVRGWEYYSANHAFWTKMAAFALMGLLSVVPTRRILAWAKASRAERHFVVPDGEIARVRRFIHLEAGLLVLLPVLAAAMARNL